MAKNNLELRNIYHKRQRLGMQDLRFMLLLFYLGLFLYTAFAYLIISKFELFPKGFMNMFWLYAGGTLLLWAFPVRLLWSYNKLGRYLFLLFCIGSIYIYKDSILLLQADIKPVVLKYTFVVLFLCKCMLILYCSFRLMVSRSINCIWNMDDLFDDELAEMDGVLLDEDDEEKPVEAWVVKARKILKKASLRLGLCLYSSILIIFMGLFLFKQQSVMYDEAIAAIQYALFSQCLFSILIWSLPMFTMYMGKAWSFYLIYVAMLAEGLRLVLSYKDYMGVFTNNVIPIGIAILYLVIEVGRLSLLVLSCKRVLKSQLIKRYIRKR